MAIVVESVSAEANVSGSDTLTITKPTGLAVGDLLVATLVAYSGDGGGGGDINLRSGWTSAIFTSFDSAITNSIQYKVADAGDVAASNFDFTKTTSTDAFTGQLIRASGQNTLNPLGFADAYINTTASSATFSGTCDPYTPGTDGALVIVQISGVWGSSGGGIRTVSTYSVVNTSLTEGYETGGTDGSGGSSGSSAYGIQSTADEIDAFGAVFSNSMDDHFGHIVVFLPPVDASGTNTLVITTSTTFNQSGIADGIIGNTLATATSETFVQGGVGTTPMQWVNESKPTTTWINET